MRTVRILGAAAATLLGTALAAVAVVPPAAAAPTSAHVHLYLTRGAQRSLTVNPGCWGTLSPGCAPIPLQYNGGPVEQAGTTNYLIFWEPTGSSVASNYNATLTQFFGDVGGSSLYGVASQYYQTTNGAQQNITNSATVGGTYVDTSAYPSSTLQDSDVQAEVNKVMKAQGWTGGIGHQFYVFLANGENECMNSSTCSFSTFCAYHGDYGSGSSTILYAAMPYAGTDLAGCGIQTGGPYPNGAATDAEISVASHELMETVTDPTLSAWYDATGAEIGDKCAYTYGPTAANGSDITINTHPYIVQEEFSNAALSCAL